VSTPVHVIDWMPTICALLDIPEAKGAQWDGLNMWPAFMGQEEPVLASRELYWQGVGRRSAALRQGDWKLVVHRRGGKNQVELFDLSADPNETTDHSDEQASRVAAMLRALYRQEERDDDALPIVQERH
jgi:arylsulfatase A-like enzyme